jgi:hypothetical protein
MTSLLVGTLLNMNMISPAMAAMGTNSYDNRYNYDKQPSYNNGYDKSSYFMDSYGDRNNDHKDKKSSYFMDSYGDRNNDHKDKKSSYFMDSYGDRNNDHKDKIKEYECRTGQFEGFLVSSVEFCDAKHKKFHR